MNEVLYVLLVRLAGSSGVRVVLSTFILIFISILQMYKHLSLFSPFLCKGGIERLHFGIPDDGLALVSLTKNNAAPVQALDTAAENTQKQSSASDNLLSLSLSEDIKPGVPHDAGLDHIQSGYVQQSSDINTVSMALMQTPDDYSIENRCWSPSPVANTPREPCTQDLARDQPRRHLPTWKLDNEEDVLADCVYQAMEGRGHHHERQMKSEAMLDLTSHAHTARIVKQSTSETGVLNDDRRMDEDINITALPPSSMATVLKLPDAGVPQDAGTGHIHSGCESKSSEVDTVSMTLMQTSSHRHSAENEGMRKKNSKICGVRITSRHAPTVNSIVHYAKMTTATTLVLLSTSLRTLRYHKDWRDHNIVATFLVSLISKYVMSKRSAPTELEPNAKCVRLEEQSALKDPATWDILERYLTTDLTYGQMEQDFHAYLGNCHRLLEWTDARLALFSGDDDNEVSLANLLVLKRKHIPPTPLSSVSGPSTPHRSRTCKNPFIDMEAEQGDEEEEEDEEEDIDAPPRRAKVVPLPVPKHTLSDAINRIEENMLSSTSSTGHRRSPVTAHDTAAILPMRMYVFTVHALPVALQASIKKWDRLDQDEATAVNVLLLEFRYPSWVRIKRGKYRDAITYVFDTEQTNNFVTVLVPPREFPYQMPKGSIVLFNPSCLPPGISTSDVIHNGKVVGSKYKGEEYYGGLLKKNIHRDSVRLTTPDLLGQMCMVLMTDHAFGKSVKLQCDLDGRSKEIKARVDDVERVFAVGNEVRMVAGTYLGLEGHIVQISFKSVKVSMYYLDHCPIDQTLQGHMSTQLYLDPPQESKTVEIGDYVQVLIGDWLGKSGTVQWASNGFIWFQDDSDLLRINDRSGVAPPFIQVAATMVECTRLSATLKFTKEHGYDVRPGDVVSVARGPEFRTQGMITVPIRFVTKMRNADLDAFNNYINKEVFIIGGLKKGFWATLYDLSTDTCTLAVHGQPRMTTSCCDVATSFSTAYNSLVTTANSMMFSSPGVSSSKSSMPEEDTYLSGSLLYKEDKAYVSVTLVLLAGPVQELIHAKGIRGKSTKVRVEKITRDLRRLNAIEEAVESIALS
ncbi:hypothetical protein DFH29DRAFT_878242 [Suillus ampliporus]|nr:hypothetical protein DFH29DRAFT_878242 [Suillus ampliporus]